MPDLRAVVAAMPDVAVRDAMGSVAARDVFVAEMVAARPGAAGEEAAGTTVVAVEGVNVIPPAGEVAAAPTARTLAAAFAPWEYRAKSTEHTAYTLTFPDEKAFFIFITSILIYSLCSALFPATNSFRIPTPVRHLSNDSSPSLASR